ncbi:MAG: lipocalin-like domain-containing protein [Acidobacteriaceae bacterium]
MNTLRHGAWIVVMAIAGLLQVPSVKAQALDHRTDGERLIGAWHLVHIHSPEPNRTEIDMPQPTGILIFTRDGHESVQLMYSKSEHELNNQYVRDGYEASFGTYGLDEATHTLTFHVQGSDTDDLLVGKDLPRIYHFTKDGDLLIRSARSDEHWSVLWKHY